MKHLVLALLVVGMFAAAASADYYYSPGWENDPYFTHQGWEFPVTPQDPLHQPPDVDQNPYDPPEAYLAQKAGGWMDVITLDLEGGLDRQGGLVIQGTGDWVDILDVWIPNYEDPSMYKQVYISGVYVTPWPTDPAIDVVVDIWDAYDNLYPSAWEPDPFVIGTGDMPAVGGETGFALFSEGIGTGRWPVVEVGPRDWRSQPPWDGWYRQPPWELITFRAKLSEGNIMVIDQLNVDTRCLPEPSTIAMLLGLATMGLVAFVRRRK